MDKLPPSIWAINQMQFSEKCAVYRQLIPDWVFERYGFRSDALLGNGKPAVQMRCPTGSRSVEISVYHPACEEDPIVYLHMIDTFNYQLMVLLMVINDVNAERYDIDRDVDGRDTHFGTQARNIDEECRAMEAGLAPGQIRQGLRSFRSGVPVFEDFVSRMGHDLFMIEPLSYHNAIVFERYGFAYTYGRGEMERIHREFQPGGDLYLQLDDSNPFRQCAYWNRIRGRSWAIHDGILGHPFTGFQMYKRIGQNAGINTFPDAVW